MIKITVLFCFMFSSLSVFAMGKQLPLQTPEAVTDFAKACSKTTQKAFKKKYPKYNIESVTYSVDAKDKKITTVTVSGSDPKACDYNSPAVVACYDFGNSIKGKCVSGKLVDVID